MAVLTWTTLARRLRGTTLLPAVAWGSLATVGLLALTLATISDQMPLGSAERTNLRFLTVALMFCPFMAVLGARRPHHLAWQWIVVSLFVILALPVGEAYFVQRGAPVSLQGARGLFVAGLLVGGFCNYLPTRYAATALAVAVAQGLLISEHLPLWHRRAERWDEVTATTLVAVAMACGWWAHARRRTGSADDRTWRDFRDAFGALWALRMQERLNTYARNYGWAVHLTWRGFVATVPSPHGDDTVTLRDEARQSWWSLLRRFVDPSWLATTNSNETAKHDAPGRSSSATR